LSFWFIFCQNQRKGQQLFGHWQAAKKGEEALGIGQWKEANERKPRRAADDHLVHTRNQQKGANNHLVIGKLLEKERKHLRLADKRKPIKVKPRRAVDDHSVCTRNQQKRANNCLVVGKLPRKNERKDLRLANKRKPMKGSPGEWLKIDWSAQQTNKIRANNHLVVKKLQKKERKPRRATKTATKRKQQKKWWTTVRVLTMIKLLFATTKKPKRIGGQQLDGQRETRRTTDLTSQFFHHVASVNISNSWEVPVLGTYYWYTSIYHLMLVDIA